jgi:hypothetical protein
MDTEVTHHDATTDFQPPPPSSNVKTARGFIPPFKHLACLGIHKRAVCTGGLPTLQIASPSMPKT